MKKETKQILNDLLIFMDLSINADYGNINEMGMMAMMEMDAEYHFSDNVERRKHIVNILKELNEEETT